MKNGKRFLSVLFAVCLLGSSLSASVSAEEETKKDAMNMYTNSDLIEKEQPVLNEETKDLIAQYQNNPVIENYVKLREMVIENYEAVLDRKETKLDALKEETQGKPGGDEIVAEMEEIVQEMYITYWDCINRNMLRFTDPRLLKWKVSEASQYEYIPVMGAGESVYVKRTPVTNAEYAEFLKSTGYQAPSNWSDGTFPQGEEQFPVNYVSYADAQAYCTWLTEQDGTDTYRLPSESEWELAAGHMPKDADFNCGVNMGRTSVDEYADVTRGAHGGVDFWGNVWEWTTTKRTNADGKVVLGVKGGSWKSDRTDCRTEYREEGREDINGYEDVGFRVIRILNGNEPIEQTGIDTLISPVVTGKATKDSITLSWKNVEGAVEYQIFEYHEISGLMSMVDRTEATEISILNLESGKTYRYIVQPVSYTATADNVTPENSIAITCE